ncbi:MerR family transcriptional regulator [Natronosporangium hydrolyticum]|uniref:MerR family transcriptional regulator n=1 Tax=Natronosporangium hydrolyticum TaxID=2811111 RepID=A0A895YJ53_9ACTN|nr:MerR family transcriptional regulator [Natronosporangium hydrolyticum]QSB15559.1 MerR family transcriptional regulator [Natronosporangium hydrolyticum]
MAGSGPTPTAPDSGDQEISGQPLYSIGAVARMVNVPTPTLRTWHERYGVVVPTRSEGGHRLYSRDQVEQLRYLADQVAAGLSPSDAHRLLRERIQAPDGQPLASGGNSLLILLAERDPFAAEFSEYFLRTEGYAVSLAMDFDDTLSKASASPDLVIVDLMISAGRGVELCRQLHEQGHGPILAICTLRLGDSALSAGASAFLPKPIEPLQLVSAVRDLLGDSAFLRRERATP